MGPNLGHNDHLEVSASPQEYSISQSQTNSPHYLNSTIIRRNLISQDSISNKTANLMN